MNNKKTIKAINFIETGFSREDADALYPYIELIIATGDSVTVDFDEVRFFTHTFFSQTLTRFIGTLGEEEYRRRIQVDNLTESGASLYDTALEYAIEFYSNRKEDV